MPLVNPNYAFIDNAIAGENLQKGVVIEVSDNLTVSKTTLGSTKMIGIIIRNVTNGDKAFFKYSGTIEVLPESGIALIKNYIIMSSYNEPGKVDQAENTPGLPNLCCHIGHVLENGSTGQLTKCHVHFN